MEFDLKKIYRDVFGYEAPASFSVPNYEGRKETSSTGQRFYAEDLSGREFFLPVWINNQLISFAVMGMTWKKTIVETAMPERGGSVNELISIDDYVFTVKGLLVDEDGNFPESGIIDLHNLFKINSSIEMRSAMSDIVLGGSYDHKVIIRDVNWPPAAGVEHVKAFEINVKSDMVFDLIIK
jgi:hypothetical protein